MISIHSFRGGGVCLVVASVVSASGCGTIAPVDDGGVPDGATDAGWTQCTTPDNVGVCGGPNNCAPVGCYCPPSNAYDGLNICGVPYKDPTTGNICHPGFSERICFGEATDDGGIFVWIDAEYDFGVLFSENGGAAHLRYADLGLWTGDPIPDPPACPTMGTIQPCGGSCGACPQGQTCFGRSPLHPVGICRPTDSHDCKAATGCGFVGQSCFTYVVQPEAQAVADTMGMCFSDSDCAAIVASLPGGGKCTK